MPWKTGDVERFKKGLTAKQKEQWVAVANSALARCLKGGGSQKDCEASAVKQANGVTEAQSMPDLDLGIVPLVEKAVRRDGTIALKVIEPGWGASGYYSRDVLERDLPGAFPKGTQMFWNHDTAEETAARPEGDLSRLAAVTVSEPVFEEQGIDGPGMYARAKIFSPYQGAIDEIAEHIGVSIRGSGVTEQGEAAGKEGPIVKEISRGKSVDFVTVPGAGGRIVELFEAAGRGEGPRQQDLPLGEGLSNRDIRELLRTKLKKRYNDLNDRVWVRDWSVDDGWVVFEVNDGSKSATYRLSMTTGEDDIILADGAPAEVRQVTQYVPAETGGTSESIGENHPENLTEAEMAEIDDLREAMEEQKKTIDAQASTIARLEERELLRDSRDFVEGQLEAADLPAVTKARLVKELAASPPLKEGKIDHEAYKERVEEAVKAAQAEVAELLGQRGQIRMGDGGQGESADEPKLEEAVKRQQTAFAAMGYGPQPGANGGND